MSPSKSNFEIKFIKFIFWVFCALSLFLSYLLALLNLISSHKLLPKFSKIGLLLLSQLASDHFFRFFFLLIWNEHLLSLILDHLFAKSFSSHLGHVFSYLKFVFHSFQVRSAVFGAFFTFLFWSFSQIQSVNQLINSAMISRVYVTAGFLDLLLSPPSTSERLLRLNFFSFWKLFLLLKWFCSCASVASPFWRRFECEIAILRLFPPNRVLWSFSVDVAVVFQLCVDFFFFSHSKRSWIWIVFHSKTIHWDKLFVGRNGQGGGLNFVNTRLWLNRKSVYCRLVIFPSWVFTLDKFFIKTCKIISLCDLIFRVFKLDLLEETRV